MKQKRIVANDIRKCHPFDNASSTDLYYQRLANQLQDSFSILINTDNARDAEIIHRAAIMLANYMEDIVADSGQWRTFSNMCKELYGHPVPMFHEDEEYYADEPSMDAIRFLLWSITSDVSGEVVALPSNFIEKLSIVAYTILFDAFEDAPINEQLADEINTYLQFATEGFNQLRSVLLWIYSNCYITAGEKNDELLSKNAEELLETNDWENFPEASPAMAVFFASTQSIFNYKIGPLALYPKDYLAAMMRTKGMKQLAEDVVKIEKQGPGVYKYEGAKPKLSLRLQESLKLTRTNGKQFEIKVTELNLPEEDLEKHDGFIAPSLVQYQGEWHLNGLLFPMADTAKKWKEVCEDDPENLKPGTMTLPAEMILEQTNGQQIFYFANSDELKDFLEEKIRFPRHMLGFVDERGCNLPTVFIDKEEPRDCTQFFFGASPCIADPNNPFYDKEFACENAINILWDADAIGTNAVKYMLDHNFLPDIYNGNALSASSTKEEKRHDIDFLMRFYRRENY